MEAVVKRSPGSEYKFFAIISIVSILTSITSLVGFVFTTILAWRKDKRDTLAAELDNKKKELEIEKAKIEVLTLTKDE